MRPTVFLLCLLAMSGPCAGLAVVPRPIWAVKGSIHIDYKVRGVEPALPGGLIDAAVAEANREKPPDQVHSSYFTDRRASKELCNSTAEYWQAPGGKFKWLRKVDRGTWAIASSGPTLEYGLLEQAEWISHEDSPGLASGLWDYLFLGFGQPIERYRSAANSRVEKTAAGLVAHSEVTLPGVGEGRSTASTYSLVLTYDKHGRLVRARVGDNDTWDYTDFAKLPGLGYYPKTAIHRTLGAFKISGRSWTVPLTKETYTATKSSAKPIPDKTFVFTPSP